MNRSMEGEMLPKERELWVERLPREARTGIPPGLFEHVATCALSCSECQHCENVELAVGVGLTLWASHPPFRFLKSGWLRYLSRLLRQAEQRGICRRPDWLRNLKPPERESPRFS